ncbi:MAG TPA: bacillithiol biosynthesis cysteine-adding enzyme BshC [Planctomycetota bacterium]|jgi:bacillithiol biosynthesis cysteine-adding enzyme BshC
MSVARVDKVPYSVADFGGTLTHDLAYGVPSALQFFGPQQVDEVLQQINGHTYPRAELCDLLSTSARNLGAPDVVLQNIDLLREPKTVVVATGQQAGFLGGPLYTLQKALTAIKLAQELSARGGGVRAVPVFWVASDDHDLAEIDHAYALQPDGTILRVRAPLTPESQGCSACDAFVDASAPEFRAQLSAALPDPAILDETLRIYGSGSMSDACSRLLLKWLGHLGLIVVQAHEQRRFGRDIFLRELTDFDVIARLIQEAAVALKSAGYKPGFSTQSRLVPHFFMTAAGRIRAHLDPVKDASGAFFQERSQSFALRKLEPRRYSADELAGLIRQQPELFSASAALRPVLQQAIFPVVAAVLGPGEIAYWAQLRKVHEHFGAVWPVIYPRATLTLIDPQGEKAMRKLRIAPGPDLFLDSAAMERKAFPGHQVSGGLDAHVTRIQSELESMEAEVHAVDAGLKPLFDKARERIGHELQRMAEKTRASLSQREGPAAARAQYLSALVRPKGMPQERVLAIAPLLAKYPALPQDVLGVIDPGGHEHLIVTLA